MKTFLAHARSYILRGLLAIIPLLFCALAIQLLYVVIDQRVMGFLDHFVELRHIPGMGILLVLICLYFIGLIVSNIVGRQIFKWVEEISQRIPLIKTVYGVGKQFSHSFLDADQAKKTFKKVLLVKWTYSGIWFIGFVTGQVNDKGTGEKLYRVFMPHVPNPVAGFVVVVKESDTMDPGWTVEEGLKMILSAGIISPARIG